MKMDAIFSISFYVVNPSLGLSSWSILISGVMFMYGGPRMSRQARKALEFV